MAGVSDFPHIFEYKAVLALFLLNLSLESGKRVKAGKEGGGGVVYEVSISEAARALVRNRKWKDE